MSEQSEIELTQASLEDIPEIADLVNSAYRGETSKAGWTTEADFLDGQRTDPETLKNELTSAPNRTILVHRANEKIQACVFLHQFEDKNGRGAYLGMLTVSPTHQASGLGRRVLEAAEDFAKINWHCTHISMTVIQLRETLIAWYERRGYKKTGEKKPFPYENPKAGLPKRRDLHFIVLEKKL